MPLSTEDGEDEDGVYITVAPIGRRWIFSDRPSIATPIIIHTNYGVMKKYLIKKRMKH